MPFIPNTDQNRAEMLKSIGVSDFEELLSDIPEAIRFKGEYNLPKPMSEYEVSKHLSDLASRNAHAGSHVCFLGGGAYDHFIPSAVNHILSRSEFYTAYTPYQPEVAQGNLQAIYEYQTMICELTGMDVSNASMYDGASALAEAALLMNGQTRKSRILISQSVHPFTRQVVATYCHRSGIELVPVDIKDGVTDSEHLQSQIDGNTAGLLVQHPNFFGCLEPVDDMVRMIHEAGGLFAVSVDPISLGILKPPGEYGADIATGEGQGLGNALNFGGPYVGIFAVKQPLVRRLPGRLVGMTKDLKGRRGFVLTLQTREQHIRREKATSSICTNEQLCALASAVYMSLMGKQGLPRVAELCIQNAHYLAEQLTSISGVELLYNQPFFKEFALRLPGPAESLITFLLEHKMLAGIDLSRFDYALDNAILIAVTEKRLKDEMDGYVRLVKSWISSL